MDPVEITAGTLHLRPYTPADAGAVFEICQDPEIQRWTQVPSPYNAEDARTFTTEVSPRGWANGTEAIFAVCDATSGAVLGSVGLHLDRGGDDQMGEIGFLLAKDARGQGVIPRATAAVCRWGFESLGLGRIEWYAEVGNDASKRVAEKVGFTMEGVLRARLVHRGTRVDAWVAGLLAGDRIGP
jgi:RimJ/RimL family protein N-acetyltransferase